MDALLSDGSLRPMFYGTTGSSMAVEAGCMPDPLRGLHVARGRREQDVRYEGLQVAVMQQEQLDCSCTMTR